MLSASSNLSVGFGPIVLDDWWLIVLDSAR